MNSFLSKCMYTFTSINVVPWSWIVHHCWEEQQICDVTWILPQKAVQGWASWQISWKTTLKLVSSCSQITELHKRKGQQFSQWFLLTLQVWQDLHLIKTLTCFIFYIYGSRNCKNPRNIKGIRVKSVEISLVPYQYSYHKYVSFQSVMQWFIINHNWLYLHK